MKYKNFKSKFYIRNVCITGNYTCIIPLSLNISGFTHDHLPIGCLLPYFAWQHVASIPISSIFPILQPGTCNDTLTNKASTLNPLTRAKLIWKVWTSERLHGLRLMPVWVRQSIWPITGRTVSDATHVLCYVLLMFGETTNDLQVSCHFPIDYSSIWSISVKDNLQSSWNSTQQLIFWNILSIVFIIH